jgi:hypothetical protein
MAPWIELDHRPPAALAPKAIGPEASSTCLEPTVRSHASRPGSGQVEKGLPQALRFNPVRGATMEAGYEMAHSAGNKR